MLGHSERRRLVGGLSARVVEIGAGTGARFAHYPPTVVSVVLEPAIPHVIGTARRSG